VSIVLQDLTKVYSSKKGIFDVSFEIKDGEVFGLLGPNGAGKTTTIRQLMGFMRPDSGSCQIDQLECWENSCRILKNVGFIPDEMHFLDYMKAIDFLKLIGQMRGMQDFSKRDGLIDRFQLDVNTKIKKMSKGMKQKLGIIVAFMHDPDILILDEPTAGLDPLMRSVFIDLILEEKAKKRTIMMSSHSFSDTERLCDRAGIIKEGKLVAVEDIKRLQDIQRRIYVVSVEREKDVEVLRASELEIINVDHLTVQISVHGNYKDFTEVLSRCQVIDMDVKTQGLEEIFMKYYGGEVHK